MSLSRCRRHAMLALVVAVVLITLLIGYFLLGISSTRPTHKLSSSFMDVKQVQLVLQQHQVRKQQLLQRQQAQQQQQQINDQLQQSQETQQTNDQFQQDQQSQEIHQFQQKQRLKFHLDLQEKKRHEREKERQERLREKERQRADEELQRREHEYQERQYEEEQQHRLQEKEHQQKLQEEQRKGLEEKEYQQKLQEEQRKRVEEKERQEKLQELERNRLEEKERQEKLQEEQRKRLEENERQEKLQEEQRKRPEEKERQEKLQEEHGKILEEKERQGKLQEQERKKQEEKEHQEKLQEEQRKRLEEKERQEKLQEQRKRLEEKERQEKLQEEERKRLEEKVRQEKLQEQRKRLKEKEHQEKQQEQEQQEEQRERQEEKDHQQQQQSHQNELRRQAEQAQQQREEDKEYNPPRSTDVHSAKVSGHLHQDVKVVSSSLSPGFKLPHLNCVKLPSAPRPGVLICLHPIKDDIHVSGTIQRGGLWEDSLIKQMANIMENNPRMQLVDLGCNIGEYTLWGAAMGRPVLAVEMLETNIHLVQKSLEISGLSTYVTLVNNAVYRDHRQLKTTFLQSNIGGTRLSTSSHNDPNGRLDYSHTPVTVNTVCLDDLLPLVAPDRPIYMKVDIENSEHHVLACAHKFFKQLDIRYVQMEWLARTREEIDGIRTFMTKYGYVPRSSVHSNVVDINVPSVNGDVLFIKEPRIK